jgi:pimeloyl-ACP methyl ester carboxylesterase
MITRELHFELPAYTLLRPCMGIGQRAGTRPARLAGQCRQLRAAGAAASRTVTSLRRIWPGMAAAAGVRPDSGYAIWQDVADVIAVADALGWDSFALLGHSRGAAIAMLTASAFPERITHLVDDRGRHSVFRASPMRHRRALAKAVSERSRVTERSGRIFPRRGSVQERTRGLSRVSLAAAICSRSARCVK